MSEPVSDGDPFILPDETRVLCPVCRDDGDVTFAGEPAMLHTENYGGVSGVRGDEVMIPLQCDRGHLFNLYVGFHKGWMFTALKRRPGYATAHHAGGRCAVCGGRFELGDVLALNRDGGQRRWGHPDCMPEIGEYSPTSVERRFEGWRRDAEKRAAVRAFHARVESGALREYARCDVEWCQRYVRMVVSGGTYCTQHGEQRIAAGGPSD